MKIPLDWLILGLMAVVYWTGRGIMGQLSEILGLLRRLLTGPPETVDDIAISMKRDDLRHEQEALRGGGRR